MAKSLTRTDPTVERGQRVRVEETGLTSWEGVVETVKWSAQSGWWAEVHKEKVGTYVMHETFLTVIDQKEM